jgi:hypothetical protein
MTSAAAVRTVAGSAGTLVVVVFGDEPDEQPEIKSAIPTAAVARLRIFTPRP